MTAIGKYSSYFNIGFQGNNGVFSYNLERAGGKFTVTPAGYILVNDKIDRETEDVHSFQVSHMKLLSNSFCHETLDLSTVTVPNLAQSTA